MSSESKIAWMIVILIFVFSLSANFFFEMTRDLGYSGISMVLPFIIGFLAPAISAGWAGFKFGRDRGSRDRD